MCIGNTPSRASTAFTSTSGASKRVWPAFDQADSNADAALGVKYLSRQDSESVGMIGSGAMARAFLEAFTNVRDIKRCRVYSPTKANREAFAAEMSERLEIAVDAVDSAREAVRDCDILSSCTDSMTPVYDADWIRPGMHVTNLGRREMPEEATGKFDIVIRQGTAGLQMKQTKRFQAERGHSPAAFIGGTDEEMKRPASAATIRSSPIAARAAKSPILPRWSPARPKAERGTTRSPFTATSATKDCNSPPSGRSFTERHSRREKRG